MQGEKKTTIFILFLIFFFFFGLSLFINLPAIQQNFLFADEATYYSMTQSLSQDMDFEYTKKDLIRYYQDIDSGPMGIFLKKGRRGKIFYAKSFAYPLFAAPFYKIFGINGFLIFHSCLLLLLLLMGTSYASLWSRSPISLLFIFTFLFASIAIVYFFWISPDFFNLFLTFAILFLWLYKQKAGNNPNHRASSRWQRFLLSNGSDYAACVLAGIAVYSKPPNIILLAPLLIYTLCRKKFLKTGAMLAIFLLVSGIFWGVNHIATGDWNYQGGERKIFHYIYPFAKADMTFDNLGQEMTSEGYVEKHFLTPRIFIRNFFYYFVGRYTGLAWYFVPALLALILFFIEKKRFYQWLLFATLAAEILIYIIFMPDNYAGGGGALANRYFLCIYPLFFFLPESEKRLKGIGFSWVFAAIFIAQILFSPIYHSRFPATHPKRFPFKLFPPELTLINNLPTGTNPFAKLIKTGSPPNTGFIHHLDDNFIPKLRKFQLKEGQSIEKGIWTRGPHKAEMILETNFPIKKLIFHLRNNARMTNSITVQVARQKRKITLGRFKKGALSFQPGPGFRIRNKHLYILKVKSAKSSIPYYESEDSNDKRNLGVYFELELIPDQ